MNALTMNAVVVTKYGSPDVLKVQTVEKPLPAGNQVLVKVYATTVTAADTMLRRADPFLSRFFLGLFKPSKAVIGTGFAGVIEALGPEVKDFHIGDAVYGETGLNFGANAEYLSIAEDEVLSRKPDNISFEEAAPICDGVLTSMNFLKNLANIQPGQKVLINGASGSLGSAAVQLARYLGAEVTGVCSSRNIEFVKSLGAQKVIDYTTTDFTKGEEKYDFVYDTVGKSSFSKAKNVLTDTGIYMSPVLSLKLLFQMMLTSKSKGKKAKFSATGLQPAPELRKLLEEINSIYKAGDIKTVIGRRYRLEETSEAHRYVDTGHKKGNVVVLI